MKRRSNNNNKQQKPSRDRFRHRSLFCFLFSISFSFFRFVFSLARVGVPRSSEIRTGRSREIVVVVVVVVAVVAKVASFLAENESTTIGHSTKRKEKNTQSKRIERFSPFGRRAGRRTRTTTMKSNSVEKLVKNPLMRPRIPTKAVNKMREKQKKTLKGGGVHEKKI